MRCIVGNITARCSIERDENGWDNIFASALTGHLKDFDVNDIGLQMFGVGLHALQDGYGHAGVSMKDHSLIKMFMVI